MLGGTTLAVTIRCICEQYLSSQHLAAVTSWWHARSCRRAVEHCVQSGTLGMLDCCPCKMLCPLSQRTECFRASAVRTQLCGPCSRLAPVWQRHHLCQLVRTLSLRIPAINQEDDVTDERCKVCAPGGACVLECSRAPGSLQI